MFRGDKDKLCQLCAKGSYAQEFSSSDCEKCPANHTTRGLGSRKASHCYYHKPVVVSASAAFGKRRTKAKATRGRLGFMFYNRWNKQHAG